MNMFDTVSVVNLDGNFKHNGTSFQTKSLDCDGSDFYIFNGQLWQQYSGVAGMSHPQAILSEFTGELNIYTDYTVQHRTYWVEYVIEFVGGKVTSVVLNEERLTADKSDKSEIRPSPKSKSTCVTLDFRGVDGAVYDAFHADLDARLDALRSLIGDAKAEIIYQVRAPSTGLRSFGSHAHWLHSVVQDLSDFQKVAEGKVSLRDSKGDSLTIIFDEAGTYQ